MAVPVHYPEPASEDTSSKQLQTIHQMIDREKKIRAFLQLISLRAGMNQNLYDVVQNINQEKLSQLIGCASIPVDILAIANGPLAKLLVFFATSLLCWISVARSRSATDLRTLGPYRSKRRTASQSF